MSKPPNSFYHLFCDRCYPPTLSNIVIIFPLPNLNKKQSNKQIHVKGLLYYLFGGSNWYTLSLLLLAFAFSTPARKFSLIFLDLSKRRTTRTLITIIMPNIVTEKKNQQHSLHLQGDVWKKWWKYLLHQRIKLIRFPDIVGLAPWRWRPEWRTACPGTWE